MIDPPIINVYLAGPLTNNAGDIAIECINVSNAIKLALQDYDYLGVKFEVYDPVEYTAPNSDHTPEAVYATGNRRRSD